MCILLNCVYNRWFCGSLVDIVTMFRCLPMEANVSPVLTRAAGHRVRVWDNGAESGSQWPELSGLPELDAVIN